MGDAGVSPVHILLAISLIANAAFGYAYLGQRDTAVEAKTDGKHVAAAAQECSQGTEQLQQQGKQREADAAPKRAAAAKKADDHNRTADRILTTPPAVPGNACASAQSDLDVWWAGKVKP